jgi:primosomal protein N' (replication factor Y)
VESVDKEAIVNSDLLSLAAWMSSYYRVNPGTILESMLPLSLNLQVQLKIKRKEDSADLNLETLLDSTENPYPLEKITVLNIYNFLNEEWQEIDYVRKHIKSEHFHYWLEWLEEHSFIDVYRQFDEKVKAKTANFVVLKEIKELPLLTSKQKEAYDVICSFGSDFALSKIADTISYSIVKALRQKDLIEIIPRKISDDPYPFPNERKVRNITLTEQQKTAVESILPSVINSEFKPFLIFGITGSGKQKFILN